MTRGSRTSRRSAAIGNQQRNDTEDEVSVRSVENDNYVKHGSTLSQKRWTTPEESNRPYERKIKSNFPRGQNNTEDTETESSDVKSNNKSRKAELHSTRGKPGYLDIHVNEERITSGSLGKKRKHSKRTERRKFETRPRTAETFHDHNRVDIGSSVKRYSDREGSVTDKSRRRKRHISREDDEVPITEILKKAQENARTKYEEPVPLSELTTDTIYIQGRSGFSAVKIGGSRRALGNDTTHATKDRGGCVSAETRTYTLIKVAITAQKFWKCTGLVYQGLLGGMAFLHFIMVHVFFNTSMEFISNYSIFSEIYTNIFSFLVALCIISIFDKFDLARLDTEHLREIYTDHAKTAIAVPLYLVTFGLHQASSKMDDQLALIHYQSINETWSNNTTQETFLEELNGWQKITITKDLLAIFAWLFVALGTRDNMLLTYLESMVQYASNAESPR
ncbi:PREDICTED: uncharacterized protein LOC108775679 [Cyphomyrmex costatus]|uniref:Transmembrane protein 237 n=1 Tax=Cyphomyrmex costatus TaxID=456900 RepID=A0A151IGV2_9HYME|nr:PREDICTED: uncharacterized protein LOC108775679 [Cyphomyrmex costatus]KYN00665.1 hypothetical protein ALC62_08523 [Cyphomyrmex costatus]